MSYFPQDPSTLDARLQRRTRSLSKERNLYQFGSGLRPLDLPGSVSQQYGVPGMSRSGSRSPRSLGYTVGSGSVRATRGIVADSQEALAAAKAASRSAMEAVAKARDAVDKATQAANIADSVEETIYGAAAAPQTMYAATAAAPPLALVRTLTSRVAPPPPLVRPLSSGAPSVGTGMGVAAPGLGSRVPSMAAGLIGNVASFVPGTQQSSVTALVPYGTPRGPSRSQEAVRTGVMEQAAPSLLRALSSQQAAPAAPAAPSLTRPPSSVALFGTPSQQAQGAASPMATLADTSNGGRAPCADMPTMRSIILRVPLPSGALFEKALCINKARAESTDAGAVVNQVHRLIIETFGQTPFDLKVEKKAVIRGQGRGGEWTGLGSYMGSAPLFWVMPNGSYAFVASDEAARLLRMSGFRLNEDPKNESWGYVTLGGPQPTQQLAALLEEVGGLVGYADQLRELNVNISGLWPRPWAKATSPSAPLAPLNINLDVSAAMNRAANVLLHQLLPAVWVGAWGDRNLGINSPQLALARQVMTRALTAAFQDIATAASPTPAPSAGTPAAATIPAAVVAPTVMMPTVQVNVPAGTAPIEARFDNLVLRVSIPEFPDLDITLKEAVNSAAGILILLDNFVQVVAAMLQGLKVGVYLQHDTR